MKRESVARFPRFSGRFSGPAVVDTLPRGSRRPKVYRAHGALPHAGVVFPDGGLGLWAVSCGGCHREATLTDPLPAKSFRQGKPAPRRRGLMKQEAKKRARLEGWAYGHPFGWVCPSCRFGYGVDPIPEADKRTPTRRKAPLAPRRRVVSNMYNVTDGAGRRLAGFGELLSCGHIIVPSEGARSGNRTRRCPDCLSEGGGRP